LQDITGSVAKSSQRQVFPEQTCLALMLVGKSHKWRCFLPRCTGMCKIATHLPFYNPSRAIGSIPFLFGSFNQEVLLEEGTTYSHFYVPHGGGRPRRGL
jgi:hypothetical protein